MAIFGFGKDKKTSEQPATPAAVVEQQTLAPTVPPQEAVPQEAAPAATTESLFSRIKRGLARTGSSIGEGSIVEAGALVPEGKAYPARSVIAGTPGKVVRETTDAEVAAIRQRARSRA